MSVKTALPQMSRIPSAAGLNLFSVCHHDAMTSSPPFPFQPNAEAPKSLWREWAKARRSQLGVGAASPLIAARTAALLHSLGAVNVLAYHALSGEPDLSALGPEFRLLTTRARVRPERRLTVHKWHSATEISPIGVRQPPPSTPSIPIGQVDAVVLPALAFDRSGFRLGYGGGFYDRFLADFTGPTIGVTHSGLLLERLPHEPHDIPLAWIVTEIETLHLR